MNIDRHLLDPAPTTRSVDITTFGTTGAAALIDSSRLGTVLAVWAHPDDESFVAGGLLAAASDAGSRIVCLTATRGERGTADPARWHSRQVGQTRTREAGRGSRGARRRRTAMAAVRGRCL